MLLSLWTLFIAMPETANYALLDQQKRDERRLAAKKKQVEDELVARKLDNAVIAISTTSAVETVTAPSVISTVQEVFPESVAQVKPVARRNEEDLFLLLAVL